LLPGPTPGAQPPLPATARHHSRPAAFRPQNKKESAPKQAIKDKSKAARRARYDLEGRRSLPQLIAAQAAQKRARDDDAEAEAEAAEGGSFGAAPGGRASSVAELRARLAARREEIKAKRVRQEQSQRTRPDKPAAKRPRPADKPKPPPSAAASSSSSASASASAAAAGSEDVGESLAFGTLSSVPKGLAGVKSKDLTAAKKRRRASLGQLLEKAEAHRETLESLKGSAEAETVKKDHDWEAALRRASGEKVKDDPKLLRRSIKRQERSKKKSAKTWVDREKQKKEDQSARQAKREENLRIRKEGKGSRKAEAKAKAGRGGSKDGRGSRKGFEGSTRTSLN